MIILGCIPYDHYVQICKIGKITQYKHFKGFLTVASHEKLKSVNKKEGKKTPKTGDRPSCIMEASKIPLVIVLRLRPTVQLDFFQILANCNTLHQITV